MSRHAPNASFFAPCWMLCCALWAALAPASVWANPSLISRNYQGPAHYAAFLVPSGERAGGYGVIAFPSLSIHIPNIGSSETEDSGLHIGVPFNAQDVLLTGSNHRQIRVKLTITGIKGRLRLTGAASESDAASRHALASALATPAGGCSLLDTSESTDILSWQFNRQRCALNMANTTVGPIPASLTDIRLAYDIDWGDIDTLPNDLYIGHWDMRIDDPDGLWLGAQASSTDSTVSVEIALRVAHDIQVRAARHALVLLPVGGSWRDGHDSVHGLSASTALTISSAPSFTVHVTCSDQVDRRCALRHDTVSENAVPVDVHLTLPGSLASSDGPLPVAEPHAPSGTGTRYTAERTLQNVEGSLSVSVDARHARDMRQTPGRYSGQLSVVFDASPPD